MTYEPRGARNSKSPSGPYSRICRPLGLSPVAVTVDDVYRCTITYGALCDTAGVPWLTHAVGTFLGQIAHWCHANGYPPINSLAVNAQTRVPGEGYDGAGGICTDIGWANEVRSSIAFAAYPTASAV